MKTHFSLAATAVLFIALISISSCAKKGCTDASAPNYNSSATKDDGSCTDVPTSSGILGIYDGAIVDSIPNTGSTVNNNQQIQITKIDDSHVQVSSYNGGTLYNFTASVSSTTNGTYVLLIPSQTSTGTTLTGYPELSGAGQTINGAFIPSTKQFTSITTFASGGNTFVEFYVGTHQ